MAVHNGSRHLPDQVQSLLEQSYPNILITILDDCSTDHSGEICAQFASQNPKNIQLLPPNEINLGVVRTFSQLLEASECSYVLLADQDDIWEPDKIEKQMTAFLALESSYGKETPLLIHSDLSVVDQEKMEIHPSFVDYIGCNLWNQKLNGFLIQNCATGCTMLFNRSLIRKAAPIPEQAFMHDWWLALVAVAAGRIVYMPEALVRHRVHADNVIGANERSSLSKFWKMPAELWRILQREDRIMSLIGQAQALKDRVGEEISTDHLQTLNRFIDLPVHNFLASRINIIRFGFLKRSFWQRLSQMIKLC